MAAPITTAEGKKALVSIFEVPEFAWQASREFMRTFRLQELYIFGKESTPNSDKVAILFEELREAYGNFDYTLKTLNLTAKEHLTPQFSQINPVSISKLHDAGKQSLKSFSFMVT